MFNNLSSYFEDPEFKNILAKYEGMVENHTPAYFDAEELTDIAEYYSSKGDENKAEDAINFALQLHPNNTDALIFKSRSLYIKGELAKAYQVMELIEDQSDREVKFLKADLLIEEKRMEEADALMHEIALAENESLEALTDITLAYMDTNQKEYSKKWIEILREKGYNETNSQKFRDVWCDYCMTFGEPEKATKAFQLSLDENPYSVLHWNGLAKCYFAIDDLQKAYDAIEFALAIDESNTDALEIKGYCSMYAGNYEEAIEVYQQLLPQSKAVGRIYATLIKCYLDIGNAEEAKKTCKAWLKARPNMSSFEKSEIYGYIALCCFNLNQPVEGMKYANEALDLTPSLTGVILQKGMLHLQLNEKEEARASFKEALETCEEGKEIEILYNIANSCYFLQLFYEAITCCQHIINKYENERTEALYLIAGSFFYLGDIKECMEYIKKIREENNGNYHPEYAYDDRFSSMLAYIDSLLKK